MQEKNEKMQKKNRAHSLWLEAWKNANPGKDILSGIVVALVSIPISMGYAQVAGLPAVYGLYGSVLPILLFGLISTSRQFVVGIDAMPAVMVGGLLATLGIEACSAEALELVPLVSLLVAVWFVVFFLVKAGRIVKYISTPVMGGFISGVGLTIIMMQIPKLLGGTAGTGELPALVVNIIRQWKEYNLLSALLGIGTVVIILVCKKLLPKVPMTVVMLVIGGLLGAFLPLSSYGVKYLPEVASGLPKLLLPNVGLLLEHPKDLLTESLLIALVVMAQTLLATNAYAQKHNYKVDNGRELLGYAAMNLGSAAVGSCPINGSVSRTGIADGFGCKSHLMSIASGLTMVLVLLFGTPLLKYLPVPVLTGIVMTALIGILDFAQAKRLWKENRQELFVFLMAFLGVLLLGTIYGVVIGMALSFFDVIIRAVIPPRAFLGQIPGHETDFYNLKRNKQAKPIEGTVLYRFSGNLFFANIGTFVEDIEGAITPDIHQVIVDARGIGNIDITATDRLVILHRNLAAQGVKFYLTEHVGTVNDQLRKYGAGALIEQGAVRRTITLALRDAGVNRPYPLVEKTDMENENPNPATEKTEDDGAFLEAGERLAEFEWAFGEDAEKEMEIIARQVAERMSKDARTHLEGRNETDEVDEAELSVLTEAEQQTAFGKIGLFDEDELLDYLELRLEQMEELSLEHRRHLERLVEHRRKQVEKKLRHLNPKAQEMLTEHRHRFLEHIKENHPEGYEHIRKILERLEEKNRQDSEEAGKTAERLGEQSEEKIEVTATDGTK